MANNLKATSTVGAKALKPRSRAKKEVRDRLERLSKDNTKNGTKEDVPPRSDKSKEDRGKGNAPDEP